MPHKSFMITLLLWVSVLFLFVHMSLKILLMSANDYVTEYGIADFRNCKTYRDISCKQLIKAKPMRILKECFMIFSAKEILDLKVQDRKMTHKFMQNFLQNLP